MKKRKAIHKSRKSVFAAINKNSAGVLFMVTSVLLTAMLTAGCLLILFGDSSPESLYAAIAEGLLHASFRIIALGAIATVVFIILDKTAQERQ